jgi:beta-glucosidase
MAGDKQMDERRRRRTFATIVALFIAALPLSSAPQTTRPAKWPWMNKNLSPDQRADLVVKQMTLDEKISTVTSYLGWSYSLATGPHEGKGADGYAHGVPRLGIPDQREIGSGLGVTNLDHRPGGQATAFPSGLAQAAAWNPDLSYEVGVVIGREARSQGFNIHLGTGVNLAREPRGGRTFEWMGEDPLLAGKMAAAKLRGIQSQGVVSTSHIYALNDQEGGRGNANSIMDRRAMRESDLLAFEFAITESDVGSVMCSYNLVDGMHSCQSKFLLSDVLKGDWGFKGYVMSDWGAVHNTVEAATAGTDQESGNPTQAVALDGSFGFYGAKLKDALAKGHVPASRLDGMVHRILRAMFAAGVIDNPPEMKPIDLSAGAAVAQRVAEQSMVLLKNAAGQLPLTKQVRSIAVIGSHADVGVMAGGGSSEVEPMGGYALPHSKLGSPPWHPSSPLKAIQAKVPEATVQYDPGTNPAAAAKLARACEVAIVFVTQWMTEGADVPNLALPDNQDQLVARIAAANRHTIVVLETGGPVLMPWLDKVTGVLEAWYPGIRGGETIANVLFGDVNPAGRLPISFPRQEADLPHPVLTRPPAAPPGIPWWAGPVFDVHYTEGVKAGYKWYDAEHKDPLFPFGFGLSYTSFRYSNLKVNAARDVVVSFDVANTGSREGWDAAQVYLAMPATVVEPPHRLIAWKKIQLPPGETHHVELTIDPRMLAIFDVDANKWHVVPGEYQFAVGSSSRDLALKVSSSITEEWVKP